MQLQLGLVNGAQLWYWLFDCHLNKSGSFKLDSNQGTGEYGRMKDDGKSKNSFSPVSAAIARNMKSTKVRFLAALDPRSTRIDRIKKAVDIIGTIKVQPLVFLSAIFPSLGI